MIRNILVLALLLCVLVNESMSIGRMQSTAAKGVITCNGKPQAGIKIKLYDHDTFTPSDRMGQAITMQDGTFFISGHKTEFTSVVPELRIYHKCGHFFFRHCSKIRIPGSFVSAGASPAQVYDAGNLQLETMTSNC